MKTEVGAGLEGAPSKRRVQAHCKAVHVDVQVHDGEGILFPSFCLFHPVFLLLLLLLFVHS